MSGRTTMLLQQHHPRVGRLVTVVLVAVAAMAATAALTYLTIELPRRLAALLEDWVQIPGYYRAIEPEDVQQLNEIGRDSWEAVSRFIESNHLHLVGLACLAIVVAAMLGGILLGRSGVAAVGAIALFLPVFGSFAGSMVFLVGIGILRVL